MNPLFSVGEVVILQSDAFPSLNCECTVLEIVPPGGYSLCGLLNTQKKTGYKTEVISPRGSQWWAESALRKKHQPGEHSFTDLMASLKNPVSV
jgi:hypothetical protein